MFTVNPVSLLSRCRWGEAIWRISIELIEAEPVAATRRVLLEVAEPCQGRDVPMRCADPETELARDLGCPEQGAVATEDGEDREPSFERLRQAGVAAPGRTRRAPGLGASGRCGIRHIRKGY